MTGFIPANNFLKIPSPAMNVNTWHKIGSTLPIMYVALKPLAPAKDSPASIFVMHVELVLEEGFVFRVSISNIFKKIKVMSNAVLIPCHVSPVLKWSMLVLDLPGLAMTFGKRAFRHIKSIQICANVLFKDCYLSNSMFDRRKLPRDAAFPAFKEGQWDDHYDWMVLTSPGNDSQDMFYAKDRLASSPVKKAVPMPSPQGKVPPPSDLASLSPSKAGIAKYMAVNAAIAAAAAVKKEKIHISEPMITLNRVGRLLLFSQFLIND